MTTQIRILVGSILLLTAAMASAQTHRVAVTVPFAFTAGSHNLPAGDYTIELNPEKDIMVIRLGGRSGEIKSTMVALPDDRTAKADQSCAIFQRYGEHYFLAEVWREGTGQVLIPGKFQQEIAHKRPADHNARVEARILPR